VLGLLDCGVARGAVGPYVLNDRRTLVGAMNASRRGGVSRRVISADVRPVVNCMECRATVELDMFARLASGQLTRRTVACQTPLQRQLLCDKSGGHSGLCTTVVYDYW